MPQLFLPMIVGALTGTVLMQRWVRQFRKPTGALGNFIARSMNDTHAHLTSWGLEQVDVKPGDIVLDVGCGGGRTIKRLSETAARVYGVDYAEASLATSRQVNREAIESGRVVIENADVSHLPFEDDFFDLVTAIETHYYWPDQAGGVREIGRVLKPGGVLLMIAEVHAGSSVGWLNELAMKPLGGAILSPKGHEELFRNAGLAEVRVGLHPRRGWIWITGRKARMPAV